MAPRDLNTQRARTKERAITAALAELDATGVWVSLPPGLTPLQRAFGVFLSALEAARKMSPRERAVLIDLCIGRIASESAELLDVEDRAA